MIAYRRSFFKSAAAAGIAAFAGLRPLPAADAEIEIDPSQPGPQINPHIYGHFIEHLGGVVYDGIWVGRNSRIPNVDGIRKQFVDDMKRIGAPNLRWPGGCFADGYHWRVGNDSWGCGGNMTGGEYATEYRKYISQFPVYLRPFLVATGPRGHSADGDVGWTEAFFGGLQNARGLGVRVDGFALHYYTDFRQTAEDGAKFDAKGWYAVLHKGVHIENVINDHWGIMGKYDPQHRTRFVIDEGGNWYRGGTELGPEYILSQTITLRDALHTAMTFDVFNRHADKIEMANVAQTINCLHSLFAALGDKNTRTPAYYTFELDRPHLFWRLMQSR